MVGETIEVSFVTDNNPYYIFLPCQGVENARLVKVSREYRSVIRDCQEELCAKAEGESGAAAEESMGQADLLYKLELIWHLVEILHVERHAIGIVLPQLLQWISLHFPAPEEQARDILTQNMECSESHPEYWDCLQLFLLQGRTDQAQKLLRLHSKFDDDMFVSMEELIRKMPMYGPSMSAVDFDFRWKHWQREVVSRIDEGEFATDHNVANLAAILAGSDDIFNHGEYIQLYTANVAIADFLTPLPYM